MYLTGPADSDVEERLIEAGAGLMLNPGSGYAAARVDHYAAFALDNGCFSAGESFDAEAWLHWLVRYTPHRATCLFAVAPDVVADAAATIERSRPWLKVIRALGFPAAFVGQDGQEDLPVPWDEFDCWFTGGSTEWKLSEAAYRLAAEAKRRGKWVHMGRVNSWRRFRAAAVSGYDSADGTFIAFHPEKCARLVASWHGRIRQQQRMAMWEQERSEP